MSKVATSIKRGSSSQNPGISAADVDDSHSVLPTSAPPVRRCERAAAGWTPLLHASATIAVTAAAAPAAAAHTALRSRSRLLPWDAQVKLTLGETSLTFAEGEWAAEGGGAPRASSGAPSAMQKAETIQQQAENAKLEKENQALR